MKLALTALLMTIGVAACSSENQPYVSSAAARDPENLPGVEWPQVSLPANHAWLSCHPPKDLIGELGVPISDLSAQALIGMLLDCEGYSTSRLLYFDLTYRGEIGPEFIDLIARMNELVKRFEIRSPRLSMNSGGGDVSAAMAAGNLMSKVNWTVIIDDDAVCYSACVLVLAAGHRRVMAPTSKVGIHRIIPVQSAAATRDQLQAELDEINEQVARYLTKNGVARTVADLMMAVPAGDIKILDRDELKEFGLWWQNAAQADIARIDLINRCGKEYVARRDAYIDRERDCHTGGSTEAAFEHYSKCVDALAEELRLPDKKCPENLSLLFFEKGPE